MKKINRIINIVLIFMLMGGARQDFAYGLRPPLLSSTANQSNLSEETTTLKNQNDLQDIWSGAIKPRWDYDFNMDKWIALLAFAGERGMQDQKVLYRIQHKLSIISIQCLLRAFLSLPENSIDTEKSRFIDEPCPQEDSDAFDQYHKTFLKDYNALLLSLSSEQIKTLAIFYITHITPAQMYLYRYRAKYQLYDESNLFIVFSWPLVNMVYQVDMELSREVENVNMAAQEFGLLLEIYDKVDDLSNFPFTRSLMEHNRAVPIEKAFVSAILHQTPSYKEYSYLDIAKLFEAEVNARPPLFLKSYVNVPTAVPNSHSQADISL